MSAEIQRIPQDRSKLSNTRKDGLSIIGKSSGDEKRPPLIVAHGLTSTSFMVGKMRDHIDRHTPYEPHVITEGVRGLVDVNIWLGQKKKIEQKVDEVNQKTGEKVALVGWSLGGRHGAEVAYENPDKVEEFVTVFSPVRDLIGKPDEVHATALYSRSDLVVPHLLQTNPEFDENVEVAFNGRNYYLFDHYAPMWDEGVYSEVENHLGRKLPENNLVTVFEGESA